MPDLDFTTTGTQQAETSWMEIVSSELRAWWEVIGRGGQARNPDPIVVLPPPLISPSYQPAGVTTIDNKTLLLVGGVILLLVMMNK